MRYILISLICVSAALALTACNTVEGAGQDISGAAQWTKDKMSGQ